MAVGILRLPKGLDYSHLNIEVINQQTYASNGTLTRNSSISNLGGELATNELKAASQLMHADSNLNLAGINSTNSTITGLPPSPRMFKFLPLCITKFFFSCKQYALTVFG